MSLHHGFAYSLVQLSDLHESAGKPTQDVMRERLHHLAAVEAIQNGNGGEFVRWADTRLDRWLVDWCLRNGKEKTAKRIAADKDIQVGLSYMFGVSTPICLYLGLQTLVDIDLFMDIHRIEDALSKHSCTEALSWCSENKTALRKIKVRAL